MYSVRKTKKIDQYRMQTNYLNFLIVLESLGRFHSISIGEHANSINLSRESVQCMMKGEIKFLYALVFLNKSIPRVLLFCTKEFS